MNITARQGCLYVALMGVGGVLTLLAVGGLAFLSQNSDRALARMEAAPAAEAQAELSDRRGAGGGFGMPSSPMKRKKRAAMAKGAVDDDEGFASGAPEPLMEMDNEMEPGAPELADEAEHSAGAANAVATRRWFPETFLFEPSVVTDASGRATVSATVPDRLTTWRILALAHSQAGAQAGTVGSFRSALPVYVDAVVPSTLAAGDVVQVPVQVVNTTNKAYRGSLALSADGVRVTGASRSVSVPPGSSVVERVTVTADRPTRASFRAALTGADAVERVLQVVSTGKPGSVEHGGTLAGPREITLAFPAVVEAGSASARLTITPGALALVRSELAAAPGRGEADDDAYLLLIAGEAAELTRALGGEVDEGALKRLRLVAAQRALRQTRSPTPEVAARFAAAALSHDDPLLMRLGQRLAGQVAKAQRPDGTFFGQRGWPLQQVVVATAEGVRVQMAHQATSSEPIAAVSRARLQASVAFARFLPQIKDGYTAASVLSTDVELSSESQAKLLELVLGQLRQTPDGARSLSVPASSRRPFGGRPSEVEATALAALAIARVGDDDAKALLPDLGATLLAAYRPYRGFGDGVTNRVALEAVKRVFNQPLPDRVEVTLKRAGEVLARQVMEGKRLSERVSLVAPLSGRPSGAQQFEVEAVPPLPGLGYQLQLSWTEPWPKAISGGAFDLEEDRPPLRVGRPASITLQAASPGGAPLVVEHRLPAGVSPDKASLTALVDNGTLTRFETEDGLVTLFAPRRRQGEAFRVTYRVTPTLVGTLHVGPSGVGLASGGPSHLVPRPPWRVTR